MKSSKFGYRSFGSAKKFLWRLTLGNKEGNKSNKGKWRECLQENKNPVSITTSINFTTEWMKSGYKDIRYRSYLLQTAIETCESTLTENKK